MNRIFLFFFAPMNLLFCSISDAQLSTGWRAHDMRRPAPTVVQPGESNLPTPAPADAIVLFDGTDLSQWNDGKGGAAKWRAVDGAMESVAGGGYIFTNEKFGDCQLHVEWASPAKVEGDSQGRGNSGVYLMGQFEIQVLDSFENKTYADGSAGSIYGQFPPLVNVCRKPGEWQSYDIVFRKPRFDEAGSLTAPARVTVLHNGVVIQDNSEIIGPSNWIQHLEYSADDDEERSLSLQDHGNPVRYRNLWIRRLESELPRPVQPYATENGTISISDESKEKLVGKYAGFSVVNREGTLYLIFANCSLEMLPLSETKFEFRKSAGSVEFQSDESGSIVSGKLHLDAVGLKEGAKQSLESR
jgi:hypothetical protein